MELAYFNDHAGAIPIVWMRAGLILDPYPVTDA